MALYVNTNVSSLNAKRMLNNSTNSLDTTYKRLASGLRINSAKDDAAGLQISNRLTSQINGLEQGNRNAQDGISLAQTAEGAMDEMTTMYQRIRTLALQSANGTNSDKDRGALQEEVNQLCAEVDRITKDTTFGGEKILTGEKSAGKDFALAADTKVNRASATVDFQVGADANQKISVNLGNKKNGADGIVGFTVADLAYANGATTDTKDVTKGGYLKDNSVGTGLTFDISTAAGAQNTLANIDKYIQAVDSSRWIKLVLRKHYHAHIRHMPYTVGDYEHICTKYHLKPYFKTRLHIIFKSLCLKCLIWQANLPLPRALNG